MNKKYLIMIIILLFISCLKLSIATSYPYLGTSTFFADYFERADNSTVGGNWTKNAGGGADVAIYDYTVVLTDPTGADDCGIINVTAQNVTQLVFSVSHTTVANPLFFLNLYNTDNGNSSVRLAVNDSSFFYINSSSEFTKFCNGSLTLGEYYIVRLNNMSTNTPSAKVYYQKNDSAACTDAYIKKYADDVVGNYINFRTTNAFVGNVSLNWTVACNSTDENNCAELGLSLPSFRPPTPADNDINNTQVNINVSCSTGNVTLWFGNLTNPINLTINQSASPANYTTNEDEGTYYYKASCDVGKHNSSTRIWIFRSTSITNCSIEGYPTINFTLYNETTDLQETGTMNFHFYYYYEDILYDEWYKNYSTTTYYSNISHCISPNSSWAVSNISVDFFKSSDVHFTYFIDSVNLTNITKIVNLYLQDGTSQIVYNVKDTFDSDLENAYIHVQKYDVGTNTYKEVEVLKTDASGNAVGRIELNTAWYRFWIYYHGELELTDGPLKITSTEKNFRLNLVGSDWSDNYENYKDISYDLSFNNATRNFRYVFNDPNLLISKACLGVQRINLSTGNKNVSGSCTTAHSGTILGAIDGNYSGRTYLATAWVIIGGDTFVLDELEQSYATEWQTYDDSDHTGVFVTFLVILSMILIGIWHPVIAIILMLFGFGIMRGLGIHYMSWPMFMALVIMGIVVLYKVGKR